MKPLQILNQMKLTQIKRDYPRLPDHAIKQPKYSDKSANALTKCIIDYLNLLGYFAERHSNEGRVIDGRKTYTDVIGQTKTIGSIKRIYSSNKNGTSDIKAIVYGQLIAIEVKYGTDRQSEVQKNYQASIEKAGGTYMIAKTFDQFFEDFQQLISKIQNN